MGIVIAPVCCLFSGELSVPTENVDVSAHVCFRATICTEQKLWNRRTHVFWTVVVFSWLNRCTSCSHWETQTQSRGVERGFLQPSCSPSCHGTLCFIVCLFIYLSAETYSSSFLSPPDNTLYTHMHTGSCMLWPPCVWRCIRLSSPFVVYL